MISELKHYYRIDRYFRYFLVLNFELSTHSCEHHCPPQFPEDLEIAGGYTSLVMMAF